MTVESVTKENMLEVASKVLGDESGLRRLVRDVANKVEVSKRDLKVAQSDLERAKTKLAKQEASLEHWQTFLTMLDGLAERWGVKDIATLPTQDRTQENPDPNPAPVTMEPEAKARMEEGKLCMFRSLRPKWWCPTKISSSQRKKGSIYCAKHHAIVHGEADG